MTRIEPRMAERRQRVREEGARGGLRRLLGVLGAVAALGAVVWFLQSPWVSVREVDVRGARQAEVGWALQETGVGPAVPTVLVWAVRGGDLEAVLEKDPWVAEAEVRVVFPSTVEVRIVERQPAARLAVPGGEWVLVAGDGMVLAPAGADGSRPVVSIALEAGVGDRIEDPGVLGSIQFLEALPPELRRGAEVGLRDGELWATVVGYEVRLGLPSDMAAKAAALTGLWETGLPDGASLDLLTPARPALREPSSTG